jgi:hypothetical protein
MKLIQCLSPHPADTLLSARAEEETMPLPHSADLPEERRKEIFLALVEAQDQEMSVSQSRKVIAQRFGVTEDVVRRIEREGLEGHWPPL